jgi:hypothetical protein
MTDGRQIKVGFIVRYYPVLGGYHDGKVYVVRALDSLQGQRVAWLWDKPGCVALHAVAPVELPLDLEQADGDEALH